MVLLKKKDLLEENLVTFSQPRTCFHCKEKIKSRTHAVGMKFYSKSSKIYIHFKCKEAFINSLRQ